MKTARMLVASLVTRAWFVPLLTLAACGETDYTKMAADSNPATAETASADGTASVATASTGGTPATGTNGASSGSTSSDSSATDTSDADAKAASAAAAASGAVLPVVNGGYQWNSASAARLYGPGTWIMDGLWNINAQRTGSTDSIAGIRFRAPISGSVQSVRLYWSDGSGYAGGNGGDIELRVLPDDGSARHLPNWSATPLATGRRVPGNLSMSGGTYADGTQRFSVDVLTSAASLQAGALYHLVAINNAADPISNWSSWDMQWTVKANGRPSRWISPTDFAAMRGTRSAGSAAIPAWDDWSVDGHAGAYVVPIMQMTMSNGQSFGNSNMETGNVDSGRVWKNTGGSPVRERFTPSQSRRISGLSLNTALVSGSGGLGWQILQGSTVMASGTITQSSANYKTDSSVGSGTGVMAWYDVALPSTVTLNAATTYDVVFTPQGSSTWVFADQRNGGAYGYSSPAAFTESQAEVLTSGSWLKANHWSHNSSDGGSNWRMVLHLAN